MINQRSTVIYQRSTVIHQRSTVIHQRRLNAKRCGKDHKAPDCPHKNNKCTFCSKVGHLDIVFRKKQYHEKKIVNTKVIPQVEVKTVPESTINAISSKLEVPITIQGKKFTVELDTGTTGNFVSVPVWEQLGKPQLTEAAAITSQQPIITFLLWEFSLELQKIQKMGSQLTSTIQYPRFLISTY